MFGIFCLTLCLSTQLTTITGECGYKACHKTNPNKLNIHLIAHSHLDVGWLFTPDKYYITVRMIISSVTDALMANSERKFTMVEMYFFHRWWKEQNQQTQDIVRDLVENGQLVFTNGGWTVNDEGAAHYNNIIDQMTLGLKFLNDTFGKCGHPKVSWQIDPFGASREMPSLYAQMGFDAHIHNRGPEPKGEYIWKGSDDLNTKIFTSILHDHYSAPNGFDFDRDENVITYLNIEMSADEMVKVATKWNKDYGSHNQVLIPMGNDFQYIQSYKWYTNMDKLIRAVKTRHSDVDIFYSTPNCYINAVHSMNKTYSERDVDYLTYWVGYYSNRPALKYQDRRTNNILQASKQLDVLSRLDPGKTKPYLDEALNQVAVLTHHDAITGTSPQEVANDYTERLQSGYSAAKAVVRKAMYYLKNKQKTISSEIFCDSLNITECSLTETNDKIAVTVYNPIARPIAQYLRVPVVDGDYEVYDSNGQKVSQKAILPVSEAVKSLPERHSKATNELVFKANLPALGFTTYFIEKTLHYPKYYNFNYFLSRSFSHLIREKRATNVMKGKSFTLQFNENTGVLNSITVNGKTHKLYQSFKWYKPIAYNFNDEESGSYNFCPDGSAHDYSQQTLISSHTSGPIHELNQQFSDHIKQTVRTYEDEEYIEFDWTVGPISIKDDLGREIITRFETDLKTDNIFYTDANGRQTIKRRFDANKKGCTNNTVSGNWYPIYSRIGIRDEIRGIQMSILTDRTQGGSSLKSGEVELMVHRRLTHEGNGGDFVINERGVDGKGLIVRGKHYLYFGPTHQTTELVRKHAESLYMSPIVLFDKYSTIKEYSSQRDVTFSALSHSLPENIHLLTLENWKPNQVLLRLEHTFEKSDNSPLSKPVELNLENLFKTLKVLSSVETTLAANQLLSESKRMNWNSHYYSDEELSPNRRDVDTKVTLSPQQIRTFILTVDNNYHKSEKCTANWVKTTEYNIPKDAFVAGYDIHGQPINICRQMFYNFLIPGRANIELGCAFRMSGREVYIKNEEFEVLVAKNVEWVPRHGTDTITEHALVVGIKRDGTKTYVGRCLRQNSVVIGEIDYSFNGFSVRKSKDCTNHEVLVCN